MRSLNEFVELVRLMRDKQKWYFKTRDRQILVESKRLEEQVDRMLERLAPSDRQLMLYPD